MMKYRHRDSGVASPRFLHINTEKNLCLYLLFISYPLCLSKLVISGNHFFPPFVDIAILRFYFIMDVI